MKIQIDAASGLGVLEQIQDNIGGELTERWGEQQLKVANTKANGTITFVGFDWGVNLLEYDLTFFEDIELVMDTSEYNPIHFTYCLEGYCEHRFEKDEEKKKLEQFQSVIITSIDGGYNYGYFPKNEKLKINVIQIVRRKFLKKRLNNVEQLNQKLYNVFIDTDHEKAFSFFGSYNLKLADKIAALNDTSEKGMIRILKMQGLVYEILSMHIAQHDKVSKNKKVETSLLTRELEIVRELAQQIIDHPSKPYTLQSLSLESGITQAKLQEGFKLLYTKTVNEYIRHIRLEAARDYMVTTDLSISEIVYTIGFTSRSYFSKIFKNKYGLSPTDFKNHQIQTIKVKQDKNRKGKGGLPSSNLEKKLSPATF
ncbi:hypothetical protein GCM10011414_07740 [Croceivirga lutea]|uniref:helix-turn-helix domain-containing protein n=1 Tax=Croceivirga lutea TaxID=1775167 RepID=UPI00163A5DC7|nr:AraC family transcriptional regulator [Croceivirga lutea]GGG40687.1 hypothetical protein GCM10011414_07740 [Croceivirga lutea]